MMAHPLHFKLFVNASMIEVVRFLTRYSSLVSTYFEPYGQAYCDQAPCLKTSSQGWSSVVVADRRLKDCVCGAKLVVKLENVHRAPARIVLIRILYNLRWSYMYFSAF